MNPFVIACEVFPLLVAAWLVSRVRFVANNLEEPDDIGPFGYTNPHDDEA